MPCMCGDIMCPSCGPAQGYNPQFETACEWIQEVLLCDMPRGIDIEWLTEELANRIGQHQELVDAVEAIAAKWARNNYQREHPLAPE